MTFEQFISATKHGDIISCNIKGYPCTGHIVVDASYGDREYRFICHDNSYICGSEGYTRLGHKFSWQVNNRNYNIVTEIRLKNNLLLIL